jgi:branched-chain amino acid transport system substrate-binding protein
MKKGGESRRIHRYRLRIFIKRRGNKMKKLSMIVLLVIFVAFVSAQGASGFKGQVKVGMLFPLTGPLSASGQLIKHACDIVRTMVNEDGGANGFEIVYVYGDTAASPETAALEANRLIMNEGCKVIMGAYASGFGMAASQVCETNKVVWWETATADSLCKRGFKYTLSPIISTSGYGNLTGDFIADVVVPKLRKPAKDVRVCIMYEDMAWGTELANAAESACKAKGIQVLSRDSYHVATTKDFTPLIEKYVNLNPDVLLPMSYVSDTLLFWQQCQQRGWKPSALIGGGGGWGHPLLVKTFGENANGVVSFCPGFTYERQGTGALLPETKKVRERMLNMLHQLHPGEEMVLEHGVGFLCGWPLLHYVVRGAVDDKGNMTPEKLLNVARALDLPYGTLINGAGVSFYPPNHPESGRNSRAAAGAIQWQNGKIYAVWPGKFAAGEAVLPLRPWK